MLDLLLINASELTGDIRIGDCQDYTDNVVHALEEYQTYESKIRKLTSRKAKFQTLQGGWSTKLPGNLSLRTRE